jgi:hypothetical protein
MARIYSQRGNVLGSSFGDAVGGTPAVACRPPILMCAPSIPRVLLAKQLRNCCHLALHWHYGCFISGAHRCIVQPPCTAGGPSCALSTYSATPHSSLPGIEYWYATAGCSSYLLAERQLDGLIILGCSRWRAVCSLPSPSACAPLAKQLHKCCVT